MVEHQAQLVREAADQFEDGTLPDTDTLLKNIWFALGSPLGIWWTTIPGTRDRAVVARDLRLLAELLELPEDDARRPSPKRALDLACQAAFDEPQPLPASPKKLPWILFLAAIFALVLAPLAPFYLSVFAVVAITAALIFAHRCDKEAP